MILISCIFVVLQVESPLIAVLSGKLIRLPYTQIKAYCIALYCFVFYCIVLCCVVLYGIIVLLKCALKSWHFRNFYDKMAVLHQSFSIGNESRWCISIAELAIKPILECHKRTDLCGRQPSP